MKHKKRYAVWSSGIAATLISKSNVGADAFGTDGTGIGPFADGAYHNYCFDNPGAWGTPAKDDVHVAMTYLADYTDMSTGFASSCSGTTDIWFLYGSLPDEVRGRRTCRITKDSSGACGSNLVTIDGIQIWVDAYEEEPANFDAAFNRNFAKTIQHEIGHSVGMMHHSDPTTDLDGNGTQDLTLCMERGHVFSDYAALYAQHHKDHVNAQY